MYYLANLSLTLDIILFILLLANLIRPNYSLSRATLITSFTSYKPLINLLLYNIEISICELSLTSFKGVDFTSFLLGFFITTRDPLPRVTNFRDLVYDIIEGVRELSRDELLLLGLFWIYTLL